MSQERFCRSTAIGRECEVAGTLNTDDVYDPIAGAAEDSKTCRGRPWRRSLRRRGSGHVSWASRLPHRVLMAGNLLYVYRSAKKKVGPGAVGVGYAWRTVEVRV